jgi:hypothetical protein
MQMCVLFGPVPLRHASALAFSRKIAVFSEASSATLHRKLCPGLCKGIRDEVTGSLSPKTVTTLK